jgi:hypothetical protein
MKHGIMKGMAIALFVAGMSASTAVSAAGPNIACTSTLKGRTVYIESGGYRHYYLCRPPTWVYLRSCPIGGGSCIS